MDLVPASSRTPAHLAALFTAGYEGYSLPVAVDGATFAFMAESWDYDLDASVVAVEDGEDVGLCLLGARGEEGWIGGVGVVAPTRGRGIGRRLMAAVEERARALGLRRLWLEVLVQNEPALALYEKLGYERVRELEVWSLDRLVFQKHKARSVPGATAQERIRAGRKERESWQRADETVAKLEGVEGLANDGAALVFRIAGERVSLLQAVADDAAAAVIGMLTVSLAQMAPHAVPDSFAIVLLALTVIALLAWRVGSIKVMLGGALLGVLKDRLAGLPALRAVF